jgi:hypothetical protein
MHTPINLRSFAFPSVDGSVSFLVINDRLEVCPLARWGGDRHLYPLHYRAAFAFSSFLYPAPQQRSLRKRLPSREGEMWGLFHLVPSINK